jgi:hypothetical protein
MHRIDENTYIDDTLVTCAEYQLFIDEMREKGRYYQPDHWTSYEFPKGQAREPILGIRHADAVAFCEWLTWKELSGWGFRLPTPEEANTFPVKSIGKSPIGYWVEGNDSFVWIGPTPKNPRNLELEALARNRDRDLTRALDLERDRDRALNGAHSLSLVLNLDFARILARDRDRELGRALDSARDLALYFEREVDSAHTLARDLERELDRANTLERAREHAHDFDRALDIYVDIFTLRERIAGRSPAFEGIRLVKERIR